MPTTCPHCSKHFPNSDVINSRHKAVCAGWRTLLGDTTPLSCLCGHVSTSNTQMKRHRFSCVDWKTRDRGKIQMSRLADTLTRSHGEGVTHPLQVPGVDERRKATLLSRYGVDNLFSRDSPLYEDVRKKSYENRRPLYGVDNPFSNPDVQAKIKVALLSKYGVDNPQKSPEIRARVHNTNLLRYGVPENLMCPEIRERIAITNQERYGGCAPSHSPLVLERARKTNLERWGFEWTCQHPDIRRKQNDTLRENYGGHYFASEEGRLEIRRVLIERYGVDHPSKIQGFWDRVVATFMRRYGVRHPLLLNKYLSKRPSVGPNRLEQKFNALFPELLYTGAGNYWRWLPSLEHNKNPDFVLPGPFSNKPLTGVTKVVELFGDYWHSEQFTGKSKPEHEAEIIQAFAQIGISCLVVWESDFHRNTAEVRARTKAFLGT